MTRHFLRFVMVAVVFAAGSLNGAMACTGALAAHGDGQPAYAHEHTHDAHDDGRASLHAFHAEASHVHDADDLAGCDNAHGCPHMHAHCCASAAVPTADCGLKLALDPGALAPEAGAVLPLGQLFYPLLRPPSAAA